MSANSNATPNATDPNLTHLHTARAHIAKGDLKSAALTLFAGRGNGRKVREYSQGL